MTALYTAATNRATSAGSGASIAGNGATSEMFTSLLVAQIRNQNPLEPTDAAQFVTQLTQLSQMESLQTLATQGGANAGLLTGLQALGFGGQIGAELAVATDHVALDGRTPVAGRFELGSASETTRLVLTSEAGKPYRIDLGKRPAGAVAFEIDPAKAGLPPGRYAVAVETAGGEKPTLQVAGRLDSVRIAAGGAIVLDVAGVGETDPDAVVAFSGRRASTDF